LKKKRIQRVQRSSQNALPRLLTSSICSFFIPSLSYGVKAPSFQIRKFRVVDQEDNRVTIIPGPMDKLAGLQALIAGLLKKS